jgi:hypothetical protein
LEDNRLRKSIMAKSRSTETISKGYISVSLKNEGT